MVLEGYSAGPWMIRLIRGFWRDTIMVCWAGGNYGTAFKASRGVTQGGPLLAKLFNIMVNAIVREWIQQLRVDGDYNEKEFAEYMVTFFAIFYVDDAHLASWDAEFLQYALTHLVHLFERIGLQTNTTKTQTMICTPGRFRMQLSMESYRWMQQSRSARANGILAMWSDSSVGRS